VILGVLALESLGGIYRRIFVLDGCTVECIVEG
jgi:uncharacterized metal-binding protein